MGWQPSPSCEGPSRSALRSRDSRRAHEASQSAASDVGKLRRIAERTGGEHRAVNQRDERLGFATGGTLQSERPLLGALGENGFEPPRQIAEMGADTFRQLGRQ